MGKNIDIAVAYGDGVGPEIMDATLKILRAAGSAVTTHDVEVGEKVYLRGFPSGIEPKSWEIIHNTKAFLKAPITTPQGGGFRSLNVTIRAALGLYANVRPCISYFPFVQTKHPHMDVVIVRENEEDLYTGLEYRQANESYHAIKIITRDACERIIRYAFEYCRQHGRRKVSCFTKDNILKMTDGLFHKVYEEVAQEYPDIEKEHWIIDIGAAKLADTPHNFDVIVLPNLYGDILSDVAAQIAGSVGLAGSANIGVRGAMFEAIHGSAPKRANQNLANPSGLLLAAIMMLEHIGQANSASLIYNAWLKTLEDGIHTYDIYKEDTSKQKVGTREFANAVIERLGQQPSELQIKQHKAQHAINISMSQKKKRSTKTLVGIDIYFEQNDKFKELEYIAQACVKDTSLLLTLIADRGATLYPAVSSTPTLSDTRRLRFLSKDNVTVRPELLLRLQERLIQEQLLPIKTENLYLFDGIPGFSKTLEED